MGQKWRLKNITKAKTPHCRKMTRKKYVSIPQKSTEMACQNVQNVAIRSVCHLDHAGFVLIAGLRLEGVEYETTLEKKERL